MRSILLALPLLVGAVPRATASPACGAAALNAAPDAWNASRAVTGDITLDGTDDVVFWRPDGASVLLYIAACDDDRLARAWRLRIPLAEGLPPEQATVELVSLLIDPQLVARACGPGERDQCEHVRQENRRREILAAAGGRALRIHGPAWPGWRLFWSPEMGGFVRIEG
jgi:hypothetical protein